MINTKLMVLHFFNTILKIPVPLKEIVDHNISTKKYI